MRGPQTQLHRRWTLSTHPSTTPWVPPALSRTWLQIFSCVCAATWEMVGVSLTHAFTSCRCPWSSDNLEPPLAATTKLKSQLAQGGGRTSLGPLSIAVGDLLTGLPHRVRAVGLLQVPSVCPQLTVGSPVAALKSFCPSSGWCCLGSAISSLHGSSQRAVPGTVRHTAWQIRRCQTSRTAEPPGQLDPGATSPPGQPDLGALGAWSCCIPAASPAGYGDCCTSRVARPQGQPHPSPAGHPTVPDP